jgi:hypothetical protein
VKYLFIIFLFSGCASHKVQEREDDFVSVNAALTQAQFSYLKGCVDALKSIHSSPSFLPCKNKSILHRNEIEGIMSQKID